MYSIEELLSLVNQEIEGSYNKREPKHLYSPIEYSMSVGGKRIRPVLCLMACNMFSDDVSLALKPAIGVEIFHNFTLLHDDIMDNAELRRNRSTVHKKWDENTAILSGDAMMIESYNYFLNLSPELLSSTLKVFNQTALEVCEGQQYDMDFETQNSVKEEEYIEMIRLKTAVLLAGSLKIGALIGGAKEHDANCIYNFGINMGLAFQLQDDYLDTFGDEATFGERIGGDILENKKTFLLINALKEDSKLIEPWLENNIEDDIKIENVTKIYQELELDKLSQAKMLEYYNKALDSFSEIKILESKKEMLLGFLNKLKDRIQ